MDRVRIVPCAHANDRHARRGAGAAAFRPAAGAGAKYVTDAAGVLDDAREEALNERLARYDRETSNQLIVYVDRSVRAGTTFEELSAEAIRTWGVGTAAKDNGAILFLFVDDRRSPLEVGYGLEGVLTDARSKRLLMSLRPEDEDDEPPERHEEADHSASDR